MNNNNLIEQNLDSVTNQLH